MKKKKRRGLFVVICIFLVIYLLNCTPKLAIRSYLFMSGYPICAFRTEIEQQETSKPLQQNEQLYELSLPPTEKATGGVLDKFIVQKYGIIYIPEFYAEI